jgi:hypothetical protein
VSTTIGGDRVVDLVVGNRRPCTVYFNFVVVANHATLSRPTIHQTAARASAVISFEFRVEVPMPFIVAYPVVSFLRRRAYTKKQGDRTAKKGDAMPPRNVHSINRSARTSNDGGTFRPSAFAVLRLITNSNFVGFSTGKSPGLAPLKILSIKAASRRKMS